MSLRKKAILGTVWAVVENFGNRIFTLIIFSILAKLLDPVSFGLVATVNGLIALAEILIDQGFTQAIIQRKELEEAHLSSAFWGGLIIGTLLFIIFILGGDLIATAFSNELITPILRVLSISFLINQLAKVQLALFQKELEFKVLAIRQLIATIIAGTVGVVMAYQDMGVWSLVAYQVTGATINALIIIFTSKWRPKFLFSFTHYKDLFGYGMNIIAHQFLSYSSTHMLVLVIGYFLGQSTLGYYEIANKIFITLKSLLVNTLTKVAVPVFAKIQDNMALLRKGFYQLSISVYYSSFPIFILLAYLSEDIIKIVFGEQWIPAAPVMQFLLLGGIFQLTSSLCNNLLWGIGKMRISLTLNIIAAGANLIFVLVGVQYNILVVAQAIALRSVLLLIVPLWILQSQIQLKLPQLLKDFVYPLIFSAGAILLVAGYEYFFPAGTPVHLMTKGLLFTSVYIMVLLIIKPEFLATLKGGMVNMKGKLV